MATTTHYRGRTDVIMLKDKFGNIVGRVRRVFNLYWIVERKANKDYRKIRDAGEWASSELAIKEASYFFEDLDLGA